ncbi:MAG: FadR family transcriptional regulator, partial [Thermomicrobiales bacterium]|nr:FadR family transcriptional regulator [Thermomicrobiales bacterium]
MRRGLQPVQKRTLTQEAFDQLVAYIEEGTLRPGDALPSQQDLADQLGVSRPVLREAMQRLEAAGLVEIRHGSGSYVAHPPAETLLERVLGHFTQEQALDLLEARLVIEAECAALAAERATDEDFAAMRAAVDKIRELADQGELTIDGADAFHEALTAASHNTVLATLGKLFKMPNYIQGIRVELALPDISEHEYESHYRLMEAIQLRDPDLARARVREHLERSHGTTEQAAALRRQFAPAEAQPA